MYLGQHYLHLLSEAWDDAAELADKCRRRQEEEYERCENLGK